MNMEADMQIIDEVASILNISKERVERESLKTFLERELRNIEAEIFKIGAKHGIKTIFELDEKLKQGEITEEEMMDDFMELDYLESRRDDLLKVMEKTQWISLN
jgi:tRNA nucleotidyltransferase/poly(A) polymerase